MSHFSPLITEDETFFELDCDKNKDKNRHLAIFQIKIWFQNHRYKTKKAISEKGFPDHIHHPMFNHAAAAAAMFSAASHHHHHHHHQQVGPLTNHFLSPFSKSQ